MTASAKRTLQRAAVVNDKTLSEFLLDSGLSAAFKTLADRRVFQLGEVQWAAFMVALDSRRMITLVCASCSERGLLGIVSERDGRSRADGAGAARART